MVPPDGPPVTPTTPTSSLSSRHDKASGWWAAGVLDVAPCPTRCVATIPPDVAIGAVRENVHSASGPGYPRRLARQAHALRRTAQDDHGSPCLTDVLEGVASGQSRRRRNGITPHRGMYHKKLWATAWISRHGKVRTECPMVRNAILATAWLLLFPGCSSTSDCGRTVAEACKSDFPCLQAWPADVRDFCSIGAVSLNTQDCGSYHVLDQNGLDHQTYYYYSVETGSLIAIVTSDGNHHTQACQGGPGDFSPPTCGRGAIIDCASSGGGGAAGASSTAVAGAGGT